MKTLGKYEILAELGTGSMGVIYRARDTILDREVALKTFAQAGSLDPELKERFYREARFCARLHHPNIVTIYDLGEQEGTAFISMELLSGYDLRKFIAERHELPLPERIRIAAAICDGLQHAHESGIIHRDIKPSNILLTRENVPKILDFGIARFPSSRLTMMGRVLGTPHYMAPEQIMGKPCDARSDLFAAALVAFELLTYAHPFAGESIPRRIMNEEPDSLLALNPAAPPELEAVMKKAMSKDPAQRYQTAADFGAALRSVIETGTGTDHGVLTTTAGAVPSMAPPPPPPSRTLPRDANTEYKMSEVLAALQAFDAAIERRDVAAARSAFVTIESIAQIDDVYATAADQSRARLKDLEAIAPPPPSPPAAPPPRPVAAAPMPSAPVSAPAGVGTQAPVSKFLREMSAEPQGMRTVAPQPPPAAPTIVPPAAPPAAAPPRASVEAPPAHPATEGASGQPAAAPMMSGDVTRFFGNVGDLTRATRSATTAAPPRPEAMKGAPPAAPPPRDAGAAESQPRPMAPASVEKPSGDVQKKKMTVLIAGAAAAAVVIIGGAVAIYAMTHRGGATRVPAVATAQIVVPEARLFSAPSDASDLLITLKNGDRVNVIRTPASRAQEWTQVQYAGRKVYPAGAMRTTDLGNWDSDRPDVAFYLLRTFAPSPGAGPTELEDHARKLSDFLQRFPNAPERTDAQADLVATNASLAKLQGQPAAPAASAPVAVPTRPTASVQPPAATPTEQKLSPETAVKRATSYWEQGEYSKAERLLRRTLQDNPNYDPARQLLARVQKAQQLESGH